MTVFTATVIDPLRDRIPAGWDAFARRAGAPVTWGAEPLRLSSWHTQAPSSMVLVHESGGAPAGLFYARHLGPGSPARFARPGRMPLAAMTECRAPAPAAGAGMLLAAELTTADRAEVVRVFERAVRAWTGRGGRLIAYRELTDADLPVVPARRRLRVHLSPRMVLQNEWTDFGAYLASLSPKWRSQLKKIHGGVRDDPGIRVAVAAAIDPADAGWLAEVVQERRRSRLVPRPPLPAGYFAMLNDAPETTYLTYRDTGGRLLAFMSALDTGTDLVLLSWGSRAEADGRRSNLYFDQYHRFAEQMVRTGRRRLVMGKALEHIKARFGARPEPLWGVAGLL